MTHAQTANDRTPQYASMHWQAHRYIIGLTGGIGSGKSVVSDWLSTQGIDIIDADIIAAEVLSAGSPTLQKLACAFGSWVISDTGEYQRQQMRAYLQAHPDAIHTLSAITHPDIRARIDTAIDASRSPYCVLAVPLMAESADQPDSLASLCQRIAVVDLPPDTQRQRAIARDASKTPHIANYIDTIIAKQASRQKRLRIACDIIDNSGSLTALTAQLPALHHKWQRLASRVHLPYA